VFSSLCQVSEGTASAEYYLTESAHAEGFEMYSKRPNTHSVSTYINRYLYSFYIK